MRYSRLQSEGYRLRAAAARLRKRFILPSLPRPRPAAPPAAPRAAGRLILLFNRMWSQPIDPADLDLPPDTRLTFDRGRLAEADAVVFHLPSLDLRAFRQIPKRAGQVWAAWSLESDAIYPRQRSARFMRQFDVRMTYHPDAEIFVPYSTYFGARFLEYLRQPPRPKTPEKLAVFIASNGQEFSGRSHYAYELMRHLPIHSCGKFLNNHPWHGDNGGRAAKHNLIADYKFTLAFENSIARDYVSEKFFDPLFTGSVPVYLGAPNVADFAPGDRCYINTADFPSPRRLAETLRWLAADEAAYQAYLRWKNEPFRPAFLRLLAGTEAHPLTRLARRLAGT